MLFVMKNFLVNYRRLDTLNYMTIKRCDIANGAGVRVSLFVSGCRKHCKGCFNSEAWDFNAGKKYTLGTQNMILHAMNYSYIDGLSILGGEPLELENIPMIERLCFHVKYLYPDKTIWIYTGYTFEELIKDHRYDNLWEYIDVLVDGAFEADKKDPTLAFRGSSNQRILKIKHRTFNFEGHELYTEGLDTNEEI